MSGEAIFHCNSKTRHEAVERALRPGQHSFEHVVRPRCSWEGSVTKNAKTRSCLPFELCEQLNPSTFPQKTTIVCAAIIRTVQTKHSVWKDDCEKFQSASPLHCSKTLEDPCLRGNCRCPIGRQISMKLPSIIPIRFGNGEPNLVSASAKN